MTDRVDGPDRSGDGDEDGAVDLAVPWAMQLAVRDDRPDRPPHLAVCEAAAAAVVTLLDDPRSVGGEWAPRVRHWRDGRIRKVVRRGRGARFAAVQALDGVEVERGGACVRAFVPGPVDSVPPDLAKLQVGGTDMPDRGRPAAAVPGGVTLLLTPHGAMTTGKAAAQCGHAAQLAAEAMDPARLGAWRGTGWAVRVVQPAAGEWAEAVRRAPVVVRDAGYTEVAPGTLTALAGWDPWFAELSDAPPVPAAVEPTPGSESP